MKKPLDFFNLFENDSPNIKKDVSIRCKNDSIKIHSFVLSQCPLIFERMHIFQQYTVDEVKPFFMSLYTSLEREAFSEHVQVTFCISLALECETLDWEQLFIARGWYRQLVLHIPSQHKIHRFFQGVVWDEIESETDGLYFDDCLVHPTNQLVPIAKSVVSYGHAWVQSDSNKIFHILDGQNNECASGTLIFAYKDLALILGSHFFVCRSSLDEVCGRIQVFDQCKSPHRMLYRMEFSDSIATMIFSETSFDYQRMEFLPQREERSSIDLSKFC